MISKPLTTCLVCLASVLAISGRAARAEVISTAGAVCHSATGAQALDIDNVVNGVRNNSTSSRQVACSVPRSSGTPGTAPTFFVDGQNAAGTCTSCTVMVYHFTGGVAASQSFTRCGPSTGSAPWEQFVVFPSGTPIGGDDYVSLLCTLPGNGAGVLYGAIMTQP